MLLSLLAESGAADQKQNVLGGESTMTVQGGSEGAWPGGGASGRSLEQHGGGGKHDQATLSGGWSGCRGR